MTGYLHPRYVESFAEFGDPRELPQCGGWILERDIPRTPYRDGMGCYPLFACRDWSQLHADLNGLGNDLVSLSLVTDPYGEYNLADLQQCFDVVLPFKEHFVADFRQPIDEFVSKRHRRRALDSLQKVCIEECPDPVQCLDEWMALYDTLIERHHLTGIKAFSRPTFAKQLSVPGIIMFRAVYQGTTVGAHLYYVQGEVAYCHLAAFSSLGYSLLASFALQWYGIEYFAGKVSRLGLGAGAGVESNGTDGLSQFKKGWSNGTRTAYFCGRVFDRVRYSEIVAAKGMTPTHYFPAYRQGEFDS